MAAAPSPPAAPALPRPAGEEANPTAARLAELEHAFGGPLSDAAEDTKEQLRRIAQYEAPEARIDYPTPRLAAVLVLLHLNPLGELSVTLTTRSKRMRSHPGETALPGGRWEEGDGEGGEWTALREANEEIGLPLPPQPAPSTSSSSAPPPPSHLLHLTTLPAFTSRTLLVVLPVVYLLLHPSSTASQAYLPSVLKPNPDEVDAVFHLPLRAFLGLPPPAPAPSPPSSSSSGRVTRSSSASASSSPSVRPQPGTESLLHSSADYPWLLARPYRLHSFSHPFQGVTPSAVTGLTADICIEVALLAAYGPRGVLPAGEGEGEGGAQEGGQGKEGGGKRLGFERFAPGQMEWGAIVQEALKVDTRRGQQKGLGRETEKREEGVREGEATGEGAVAPA
ncbi:hypothetical protein JCM6882_009694 [Rhodosporidiobolus microsporus]